MGAFVTMSVELFGTKIKYNPSIAHTFKVENVNLPAFNLIDWRNCTFLIPKFRWLWPHWGMHAPWFMQIWIHVFLARGLSFCAFVLSVAWLYIDKHITAMSMFYWTWLCQNHKVKGESVNNMIKSLAVSLCLWTRNSWLLLKSKETVLSSSILNLTFIKCNKSVKHWPTQKKKKKAWNINIDHRAKVLNYK